MRRVFQSACVSTENGIIRADIVTEGGRVSLIAPDTAILPDDEVIPCDNLFVTPGLIDVHVQTQCLETSNADVMLDTTLDSFESLKGYAVHPEHLAVANGKVRPYTKNRVCMDYEVEA